jgi:hypothetical protein
LNSTKRNVWDLLRANKVKVKKLCLRSNEEKRVIIVDVSNETHALDELIGIGRNEHGVGEFA